LWWEKWLRRLCAAALVPGFCVPSACAADLAPPRFANHSPTFAGRTYVEFLPAVGRNAIVYTLDGREPSAASTRYTRPVLIAESTVVKARALGGGDTPRLGPVASKRFRRLKLRPVREIRISFQPADAPLPIGYLVDSGKPFHVLAGGTGYGWSKDNTGATAERGRHPNPLRDTLIHFRDEAYWELGVRRGVYLVSIMVGDSEHACEDQKILAEGQLICQGLSLKAGQFKIVRVRVKVDDGLLTLSSPKVPHGPKTARMNWIDIRPAPEQ